MPDEHYLLRQDLLAVLNDYRSSFETFPMPDRRQYDVAQLEKIIHANYINVHVFIETIERYLQKIRTLWWPFYNKSRLRDNLMVVIEHHKKMQGR